MAPNPSAYQVPGPAIDINAKGIANLYHAMAKGAIRRVVLMSSAIVRIATATVARRQQQYPGSVGTLYRLTKIMQEMIARSYFQEHGIKTTILRPHHVVSELESRL